MTSVTDFQMTRLRPWSIGVTHSVDPLPPLPQLRPHLHQRLHFLRRWQPAINHPAVFMGTLVGTPESINAECASYRLLACGVGVLIVTN